MTRKKNEQCNFCSIGAHGRCPGAVRANDRVRVCYCCAQPPRCLECHAKEDIDVTNWRCQDTLACRDRVLARRDANPLYRQIVECREIGRRERVQRREERALHAVEVDAAATM